MEDPKLALISNYLPPSKTQKVLTWLSLNMGENEYCITYADGTKVNNSLSWLVLTNKRVIFTADQLVNSFNFGECFQEVDLEDVEDGHFQKKMFSSLGEIAIKVKYGVIILGNVGSESGNNFVSSLLAVLNSRG